MQLSMEGGARCGAAQGEATQLRQGKATQLRLSSLRRTCALAPCSRVLAVLYCSRVLAPHPSIYYLEP